ncbi:SgrR family transcriptional regulator [Saccharibacillus qingshengii]|uniref:SgrR family transcriptional regulator n=1 Tax=Saccharibacillus qingshengii TaxID=1763540 RepID=UPI003CCD5746
MRIVRLCTERSKRMDHGMMQYLQIYDSLKDRRFGGEEEASVTVAQLAELLHCTPRNVKFVLRKLEEAGWIGWMSGLCRMPTRRCAPIICRKTTRSKAVGRSIHPHRAAGI